MNSDTPLISIIVPTYQGGAFLDRCLQSVVNQVGEAIELIVIDGGSTDNSSEIIHKYANRIHYWESKPDLGQTDAINTGFAHATGTLVSWLNSDDYLEPTFAQELTIQYRKNSEKHIFCGRASIIDPHGRIVRVTHGVKVLPSLEQTLAYIVINQPETYFKRSIVKPLFPLSIALQFTMDKQLWMRYLLHYGNKEIHFFEATIVNFQLHEGSKTSKFQHEFNKERDQMLAELIAHEGETEESLGVENLSSARPPKINFKKVLHHHLLIKTDELFVDRQVEAATRLIRQINPLLILPAWRLYLSLLIKLTFRSATLRDKG